MEVGQKNLILKRSRLCDKHPNTKVETVHTRISSRSFTSGVVFKLAARLALVLAKAGFCYTGEGLLRFLYEHGLRLVPIRRPAGDPLRQSGRILSFYSADTGLITLTASPGVVLTVAPEPARVILDTHRCKHYQPNTRKGLCYKTPFANTRPLMDMDHDVFTSHPLMRRLRTVPLDRIDGPFC
jgi:hypothetical protein